MMRGRFIEQLEELNTSLVNMGATVEQAIADATSALVKQDSALSRRIINSDDTIDSMEKEIESLCLRIILQQQPVAGDLRLVSAVIKIITDLERIGDHAADISEIALLRTGDNYVKKLDNIPKMAEATRKMVNESIDAYVKKDLELARKVISSDDIVDSLFVKAKNDLIELINKNATNGDQAIDLVMIAKYFERIGDHATNVAEWVVFSLTGMYKGSPIM
jgi:phosphate transport system protein